MSVIINTNLAATNAAYNLSNNNAMLQKSLARLSSGSKITSPADDAGGLAVSMRMTAEIKRTDAANTNLTNAASFLQVQDGAMKTAGDVLNRISELKILSSDPTKNAGDVANYDTEFTALQGELTNLTSAQFNGVPLFVAGGGGLSVGTSEDGAQTMTVTQSDFAAAVANVTGAANLAGVTVAQIAGATTNVATNRAQNGAEASLAGFAAEMLSANSQNLQAADSQITDVDVAQESTALAKNNILVQASTAMLAQANQSTQSIMKLLQ